MRSDRAGHRTTEPWALQNALGILMVGAVAAILVFTLTYGAIDGEDKDRFDVGIKAATATAAIVAGILTWGRLELSRFEHRLSVDRDLTERYGRAVEQLGNAEPTIRVGGVFAMERYALDAVAISGPDRDTDWRMAIDVLADFARHHATKRASDQEDATSGSHQESPATPVYAVPAEVVAAVRTLGRFAKRAGHPDPTQVRYNLKDIYLAGVNLSGDSLVAADLIGADLTRALLTDANLNGANLIGARLIGARLVGADLTYADLVGADLTDADLGFALLSGAVLTNANLTNANLGGADLTKARLLGARLTRAKLGRTVLTNADLGIAELTNANLSEADLTGANLTGADLTDAHVTRANLTGANLTNANLGGADLRGADLTNANVTAARFDERTVWPQDFSPPSAVTC
jgi:uncharacterized protein YjbI with pentapeptide repeats